MIAVHVVLRRMQTNMIAAVSIHRRDLSLCNRLADRSTQGWPGERVQARRAPLTRQKQSRRITVWTIEFLATADQAAADAATRRTRFFAPPESAWKDGGARRRTVSAALDIAASRMRRLVYAVALCQCSASSVDQARFCNFFFRM